MMQQEDSLLVSYVAGKLINVIATINQTPTSPLTSLRYVLAATIPSKPFGSCAAHITLLAGILYFD